MRAAVAPPTSPRAMRPLYNPANFLKRAEYRGGLIELRLGIGPGVVREDATNVSKNQPAEQAQPTEGGGMKIPTMLSGLSLTGIFAAAGGAGRHWGVLLAVAVIMIVCATVTAVVSHLMPQNSSDRLQLWTTVIEYRGIAHRRRGIKQNAGATPCTLPRRNYEQHEIASGGLDREL